jgi:hypothetical protein
LPRPFRGGIIISRIRKKVRTMEIVQDTNKIKAESINKLRIKDIPEISGLELIKHVESKGKTSP